MLPLAKKRSTSNKRDQSNKSGMALAKQHTPRPTGPGAKPCCQRGCSACIRLHLSVCAVGARIGSAAGATLSLSTPIGATNSRQDAG